MNKKITNHPSALDINEIWAAIEPQVDKINAQRKKRKPVFIYWLSGLALLVGLSIAGLFFWGDNFQQSKISKEPLPQTASQTVIPIEVSKSETFVNEETIAPMTTALKTAPVVTTILTPKTTIAASTILENTPIIENGTENNPTSTTTPPQQEVGQASAKMVSVKEEKMASLLPLAITNLGLNIPTSNLPELDFSINNNNPIAPPLYIERPTFSLEFQTGISMVNRTLSATENRDPRLDTLLNLRNTFEEPLEALHANLLVNAHFPSGFFVSSGIGFTQINERYRNNSTVVDSIIDPMGIQKLIININGDTIPVIGPVISTRTTTFTKRYYNSYRMIDIPFFVGYQYDFGDWKTDFSLGVFANILLATEGRIPNTPTTDLDLTTDGDKIYRSRVDYSLQFGIGVSKSITDKLSIRVNPMFRYYSRNFINESVGLNQRYLLFGGTVGLRMDL